MLKNLQYAYSILLLRPERTHKNEIHTIHLQACLPTDLTGGSHCGVVVVTGWCTCSSCCHLRGVTGVCGGELHMLTCSPTPIRGLILICSPTVLRLYGDVQLICSPTVLRENKDLQRICKNGKQCQLFRRVFRLVQMASDALCLNVSH